MSSFDDRHRRWDGDTVPDDPEDDDSSEVASTGSEAGYLRSLIDSRTRVTVVLCGGERVRGRIRYYDRDTFSVGPAGGGPKIFLRKADVKYILED